jgi:hypothetical protein
MLKLEKYFMEMRHYGQRLAGVIVALDFYALKRSEQWTPPPARTLPY